MRKPPATVAALTDFGRIRLSQSFFMRDFLFSDIAAIHGLTNVPDDPELAIAAGRHLCEELLEPLQAAFGRVAIRSAYRSCTVNALGNARGYNCAANEKNYAGHIWDRRDAAGRMGATACIVVPAFIDAFPQESAWTKLAWWIHDHLPYSTLEFYPKLGAFNIQWREEPERRIDSYVFPKGCMTKPGMTNHAGRHDAEWAGIEQACMDRTMRGRTST
ncbi:hypothetical protein NSE01_37030 [Novosphingobium sediminis]|uniref:Peptidase M15 n=1 Tax=Novosphingobium sediminis TaxID=707214 RepID=A0A512AQ86_9SPHN|nr:hypothetical protein [Novosphingobium sediminis]GEO01871.1 hypothetical protein NSE01_37030 [Novosphingobium sediminis]